MHITEFFEQYIDSPGTRELGVIMPNGNKATVSIVTQYIAGMNHHDIEIWCYELEDALPDEEVEHWCKDVSDWLVEAWEEKLNQ